MEDKVGIAIDNRAATWSGGAKFLSAELHVRPDGEELGGLEDGPVGEA